MKDPRQKSDVDRPMGNAELRLTLQSIESELADTKGISMEVHNQAKYTNGKVMWLTKGAWLVMGALPLLTVWSMWLTKEVLERQYASVDQKAVVQAAVLQALEQYQAQPVK